MGSLIYFVFTIFGLNPRSAITQQVVSGLGQGFDILIKVKMRSIKYELENFCGKGYFSVAKADKGSPNLTRSS